MIRRLILSFRLRRAARDSNAYALLAYRRHIGEYLRWIDDEAIAQTLGNLQCMAGDNFGGALDVSRLRECVRSQRAAELRAAHDAELCKALAHLRLLVREIEGVDEKWADERRRCTLNGGVVTLGQLRAAKQFMDRIDSERIKTHEAARG